MLGGGLLGLLRRTGDAEAQLAVTLHRPGSRGGVRVEGLEFRVEDRGVRVQGFEFGVSELGIRVQG